LFVVVRDDVVVVVVVCDYTMEYEVRHEVKSGYEVSDTRKNIIGKVVGAVVLVWLLLCADWHGVVSKSLLSVERIHEMSVVW
jgi:hypothetical protein